MQETQVRSPGWEDPLEKENGNPLQYSCLENPMDRGARQAMVPGVARGCIPVSPRESGLVSRGRQGLRSPLEFQTGSKSQLQTSLLLYRIHKLPLSSQIHSGMLWGTAHSEHDVRQALSLSLKKVCTLLSAPLDPFLGHHVQV